MKRRNFFMSVCGVIGAVFVTPVSRGLLGTRKYGAVDVHRHLQLSAHGIHLYVFHQGKEVTNCRFFDDELDYCECYKVNAQGRKYMDREKMEPAMEILRGIDVRKGPPFKNYWSSSNVKRT